jgi:hypothetical protein
LFSLFVSDEIKKVSNHRHLKPLDGVPTNVEDTVFALFGDLFHRGHGGAVQVAVVLSRLDELMILERK